MANNGSSNGIGRLADFLPYQLSVTSNAVSSLIAQRYRSRFGLKITEWRVMAVLGDAGEATQRELTEATKMDKVAVNRACKVLEERGLVTRAPNRADGRSHLLALTDEGRGIYGEIMPLALDIESEIFSALGAEDSEKFRLMLKRVFEQAEKLGPAPRI